MPAKSKKQQKFFGAVHACQKSGDCASSEVKKVAGSIDYKDADEFASTKHKGLPEKKNPKKKDIDEDTFTCRYRTTPEMWAKIRGQYDIRGIMSEKEVKNHFQRITESTQPAVGLSFKKWFYQNESLDNPDPTGNMNRLGDKMLARQNTMGSPRMQGQPASMTSARAQQLLAQAMSPMTQYQWADPTFRIRNNDLADKLVRAGATPADILQMKRMGIIVPVQGNPEVVQLKLSN